LAYRKCGNVELAAVVDIDPAIAERSGKEFNVRYYTQIDDVLGLGDVDIIDICTPTQFHRDLAIKVAKAGKHCICEKPMSLSDAECGEMIEAFRRSGKVIGSVFQHRFSDAARQVREAIDKGWLGKILTITAETNWWRNPLYWSSPGRGTWRRDGGGILMVQAIHAIDLMLYFGGPITDISAMTSTQVHHIEAEDTGGALLRFNSGAIGVVQATTAANTSDYTALQKAHYMAPNPKEGHKVRVVGSLGTITIENDTITEWNLVDTGVKPNPRSTNRTEHHELLARNLDDIAGAAMRFSKPVVSAESAAATVGVVHAMYGAALTCERREAEMINSANLELTPDIPERTILCHVVTDSILPDMQLKEGVLNRLEANMRSPKFGEKIVALSVKNPDNAAEYMAKLSELKRQIESEYQGYKVQFDVACPKPEYVESIQRLGMQALAFDREGEGDIIQIEGIILALRALRTGSIASLISAYKTITGKDYTTDKADINELAKIMLFILPVRKIDVDKIGKINKLIEEYIKAAA
jgi:predicted dehydrogenase